MRTRIVWTVALALSAPAMAALAPRPERPRPVPVRIAIRNTTASPLLLVDWEKNAPSLAVAVTITASQPRPGRDLPDERLVNLWTAPAKDWFRALPPGDTVLERTVTPLVPGWADVAATLTSSTSLYREPGGEEKKVEGVWLGAAGASARVLVSGQMGDEMKRRYESHRRRLADAGVPLSERRRLLEEIAAEKHCFAARLLGEVWQSSAEEPVRESALAHLLVLARLGTAYEAFPALVTALGSDRTPGPQRLGILEWLIEVLAAGGRVNIAGQAVHVVPEPLRTQGRDVIRRLVADQDAAVAARARRVVEGWEKED
jgi:hypothetical protein